MGSIVKDKPDAAHRYDQFHPATVWDDPSGVPINAHGGSLLYHEGVYFWYGEHKIEGKAGNQAWVGVHCYCSGDLHNWDDQGIALLVSQAPNSEISKGCILERPKVIYNSKTKKFVMWFHLEHKGQKYNTARSAVAVANSPTGPFTFLHSLRPNAGHWPINASEEIKHVPAKSELEGIKFTGGPQLDTLQHNILGRDFNQGQMARDMTLFVDDDEKAYHIYSSENNSTLHISPFTDDYLAPNGTYSRVFPNRWMEAPAICKHQGKYYLLASGCSG